MTAFDVTEDERDLILQMRAWKDGIPDDAIGLGKDSAVYMSLLSARAELYLMAIRHGHNDLINRQDRFLKLCSANVIIRLVRAWEKLQERNLEDQYGDDA